MKRRYMMLSLLISGPRQPVNDIDVYLAPLIDDLKLLWNEGVRTFDASREEYFNMRVMLMCTINDFPAYGYLSWYSIEGYKACPICGEATHSRYLKNCQKMVYRDIGVSYRGIILTGERKLHSTVRPNMQ
ncbi:unnamed protein product [Rhodiola kirilowii]